MAGTVHCLSICTASRTARREGCNAWGRMFLEVLVGTMLQEWDIWFFCPPQMGKGAQRHFFIVLPAEGTIGPCWRQVTSKLGSFAALQSTHTGVAPVCTGGHMCWGGRRCLQAHRPVSSSKLESMKQIPSPAWSWVGWWELLLPLLSISCTKMVLFSSIHTHPCRKAKGKLMLYLSPSTTPSCYKPCLDWPFDAQSPQLALLSSHHPRGIIRCWTAAPVIYPYFI